MKSKTETGYHSSRGDMRGVETRALVYYRAILGGQGAERKREDGTVVQRGVSEKVRVRRTTENERRLRAEVLTRRVGHFTRGVLLGSRGFIDRWFERNREICQGRSRTERKRGAKSLGRAALRGMYALRDVTDSLSANPLQACAHEAAPDIRRL